MIRCVILVESHYVSFTYFHLFPFHFALGGDRLRNTIVILNPLVAYVIEVLAPVA
jgi:hypothetical protein